jgi:hypothetical protein
LKVPLPASAGVDLCLNNNIDIAQLTRDLLRFIECRRDSAARCSHIEFLQQLLWLDIRECSSWYARQDGAEWNSRAADQQRFFFWNWLALRKPAGLRGSHEKLIETVTLSCALLLPFAFGKSRGHTSAQEKAFTDKYKSAMEGKDTATLEAFLYTQGSDPQALEFYKMMQSGAAGEKITSIELVSLTPEDVKKATTPMDGPTGKVCLKSQAERKKLVIKVETKDANGSSSSSSENFVAEKEGKFVIPVPGPM